MTKTTRLEQQLLDPALAVKTNDLDQDVEGIVEASSIQKQYKLIRNKMVRVVHLKFCAPS